MDHLRHNAKRQQMEMERSQEIDNENMILLGKMRSIFLHGTVASNSGLPRSPDVEPRSLNHGLRRGAGAHHAREPRHRRAHSQLKPSYSAEALARERPHQDQLVRRISRHGLRRSDVFTPTASQSSILRSTSSYSRSRPGALARRQHRQPAEHAFSLAQQRSLLESAGEYVPW